MTVSAATEFAWSAFLNQTGEPLTASLSEAGVFSFFYTDTRDAGDEVAFEVVFVDARLIQPKYFTGEPGWKLKARLGVVYVDKMTGGCRVEVNDGYDPAGF